MTAEVAILNKTAVALAADSAVTMQWGSEQKIYNTVNKLFTLSKYQPVGIMVYGNAEFMGIPWETIIKYYRSKLQKKCCDSLREYANGLITFLEAENTVLWTPQIQFDYFRYSVSNYLQILLNQIDERVKEEFKNIGPLTQEQVQDIVSAVIARDYETWKEFPLLSDESEQHARNVVNSSLEEINKIQQETLQSLPITDNSQKQILDIIVMLHCRNRFSNALTGVVVAGFGEKEVFPSAITYNFDNIVSGKLKYVEMEYSATSRESNAIIMPFAQREMVSTFMEGVDPTYRSTLWGYLKELILKYPESIIDTIPELSDTRKGELIVKLSDIAKTVLSDFSQKLDVYTHESHVSPVLQAVAALPKDELAAMAESLVNLTSFKRKVSLQAETVGGPIDVAVISKGDGFIWIKRKHYFKPELNQHFFSNYYRQEDCD